jgi:hypothetical protein
MCFSWALLRPIIVTVWRFQEFYFVGQHPSSGGRLANRWLSLFSPILPEQAVEKLLPVTNQDQRRKPRVKKA